jgi:hypothetical protein
MNGRHPLRQHRRTAFWNQLQRWLKGSRRWWSARWF